jgi:hypothetical protein
LILNNNYLFPRYRSLIPPTGRRKAHPSIFKFETA